MTTDNDGYYRINGESTKFVFANNNGELPMPFHPNTGLPMLTMFRNIKEAAKQLEVMSYTCAMDENNQNLSPTQCETLRWHWRLGHASMASIHWLAKQGENWVLSVGSYFGIIRKN